MLERRHVMGKYLILVALALFLVGLVYEKLEARAKRRRRRIRVFPSIEDDERGQPLLSEKYEKMKEGELVEVVKKKIKKLWRGDINSQIALYDLVEHSHGCGEPLEKQSRVILYETGLLDWNGIPRLLEKAIKQLAFNDDGHTILRF